MGYVVYKVSADFISKIVILYNKCQERNSAFNKNFLSNALGTSIVNAQNAIKAAEQLGLFKITEKFSKSTKSQQKIFFRKALQSYVPFFDFIEFLYVGEKPEKAIKIVKNIHKLTRSEIDLLWIFKNWGKFSGIFKDKKGDIKFREEINTPTPNKIKELVINLDNELRAKIWIKNIIGNAFNFLSQKDYENLIDCILKIGDQPRESIRKCGETLEDFLRKIAKKKNIDVSSKNGISQISQELRKSMILASKHVNILRGLQVFLDREIFDGFSSFRNMATHGIDKQEGKTWELSSELALTFIIQVILCIKSLYYYVIEQKLTF